MGKLNLGILGGFSGAVGTVVGSTNKNGDDIIRAKSKKARNSFTTSQVNQQTKFSLVTSFMQPLNIVLKSSFKTAAGASMSPYNYACKYALKYAIIDSNEATSIDYAKVQISEGLLSRCNEASAVLNANQVNFSWEYEPSNRNLAANDKAVLLVYNVTQGELSFSMAEVDRSTKNASVPLPYCETGDVLLFYMYFSSALDAESVSKSQYLGSETAV